jgi:hypothetical protein
VSAVGGTIVTVGGLWSAEVLGALRDDPTTLPGTAPADYGLPSGFDLRNQTRASWSLLKAAWADFSLHRQARVEADGETYGSDPFTWDRWLRHLLGQLGYDQTDTCPTGLVVEGGDEHDPADRYPISRLWADRVPLLTLPAGVPLDRTTPGVPGAAKQSPHSTVQDYLNRTSGHLWGVVTNGLTLRLLRDNAALTRQAYVEFDIATMLDDDNYADFAVLWAAVHSSRFAGASAADSYAERWQQHATDTGVRALHTLREGVERAILQLGKGLIEHPDNQALRDALAAGELDGQEMYRQLLYVAYRHVFLFAVEDRGLLHEPEADPAAVGRYRDHYSTARLRDQARRHTGGQHPDGWAGFQTVAAALADPAGQPLLALPPMLGHLWSPESTRALNGTTLANRRYYAALRDLAYVVQDGVTHRIDYRNLGSDELGAVYESLLELTIDVSPTSRTFEKRRGLGSDRKTTGSYYTPTSLISRVLDDALDPVIARTIEGKTGHDAADALLDLTICDPAMGSAHFLVAAAHRLAKHVASHRTGNVEPDPDAYRQALRDVVSRCIYGVDVNPMAVELAKISLWLECHVPGQPLTFLDHHLKCGNALLGVGFDRDLIDWQPQGPDGTPVGGVPDAAFKAVTGDDTTVAKSLKSANKTARAGGGGLFGAAALHDFPLDHLVGEARGIAWMDDTTPEGLTAKQHAWMVYGDDDELRREQLKADAWTACWTIPKTHDHIDQTDRPHDVFYDTHYNGMPSDTRPGVVASRREAERLRFFHWYVEFPEIADAGGFACMLGNPPWEVMQMTEEEWFTNAGREDIAKANNAAARKRAIAEIEGSPDPVDRQLAEAWIDAQQASLAVRQFASQSGRYRFGAAGKINLYGLFAEHFLTSHRRDGAAGFICPDGLAVGATYAPFFGHLVANGRLKSFWSFENESKVFPEVHNETKFALVTFDHGSPDRPIGFTGWVRHAEQIDDPYRAYTLTAADIAAINPNTLTAPLFRRAANATVTARLHAAAPVLAIENPAPGQPASPWHATSLPMFNMADDSGLFVDADSARADGYDRQGNVFLRSDDRLLPLYEGKMIWHYDHRFGTYTGQTEKQANKGVLPHTNSTQKERPGFVPEPRYWLPAPSVRDHLARANWEADWLIAFRDVGPTERTFIPAVIPPYAVARNNTPLLIPRAEPVAMLVAALSSLVVDFALRQKSNRMTWFVVWQAPVLPPESAKQPFLGGRVLDFVAPRVAELVYTAHDVAAFADDIGFGGRPFRWYEARRPVLQAELDAAMFHLYGLDRDDVETVLDSFTVLAKYELRPPEKGGQGEFRTKRLVLERYDAMVKATETSSGYECPLDVPPAHDSLRHA